MWITCSKLAHLKKWKFSQKHNNFAKVGRRFCQILNKSSRNGQTLLKFYQGGKISPNNKYTISINKLKNIDVYRWESYQGPLDGRRGQTHCVTADTFNPNFILHKACWGFAKFIKFNLHLVCGNWQWRTSEQNIFLLFETNFFAQHFCCKFDPPLSRTACFLLASFLSNRKTTKVGSVCATYLV